MTQHWMSIVAVAPERWGWMFLIAAYLSVWILSTAVQRRWAKRLFGNSFRPPTAIWPLMLANVLVMSLIVFAATDPRRGMAMAPTQRPSLQIVCVLDRSRSMLAADVVATQSRLELGKKLVHELLGSSMGTPFALVTFAGDVRIDVPLTRDHGSIRNVLETVDPNKHVFFGSNLGEAVARAMDCFADRMASDKRLIVITDGEMPSGVPMPAFNVPDRTTVDFVVIGDAETGGRIPIDGATSYLTHEGQVVWTRAEPELAKTIAKAVDGRVVHVDSMRAFESANRHLRQSVQMQLQKQTDAAAGIRSVSLAQPLYGWLVLAALGLLVAEALVTAIKHDSRRMVSGSFPSTMLMLLALAVLMGAASNERDAASQLSYRQRVISYNYAVAAYRSQDYETAEQLFREATQDKDRGLRARSTFNLANTIYRSVSRGGLTKQRALVRLAGAIELYRHSIEVGHRPDDAEANIRIVQALIQQIEQQASDPSDPAREPESGEGDSEPPDAGDDSRGDSPPPGESGERPSDADRSASQQNDQAGRSGPGPPGGPSPAGPPARRPLDPSQAESLLDDIRERTHDREASGGPGQSPAQPEVQPAISSMPW